MNDRQIGPIRPGETAAATRVLACAFATSPGTVAVFGRQDEGVRRRLERLVAVAVFNRPVQVLVARRDGRVVGMLGMIEWPRCQPSLLEKLRAAPPALLALRGALPRAMRLISTWQRRDPRRPHWHIGPVGVQPERQGRGIGSQLLAACLALVDQQHSAAYLVTDKPENVRFYRRFGFAVTAEEDVIGVHSWYMWREAR